MRLTFTVLFDPEEGEEYMQEVTASVDFQDPEGISLESVFRANRLLKDKLEKHYDVKLEISYESNEVVLLLLESSCDESDLVDLLENMRATLIKDLELLGFETTAFAMLFLDMRIPKEHRKLPTLDKGLLN